MSAPSSSPLVIIGSGMAGYTLARETRKRDPQRQITIFTTDGGEAYSKPMLSNALAQKKSPDQLVQKSASLLASELGLTILPHSRVTGIDRAARHLSWETAAGVRGDMPYGALVLALGADPRPYRVAGSENVPVQTVNDLDAYRNWRTGLTSGDQILLIGAGLIGCEFANDLQTAGYQVTVVEPAPWPLGRLLPEAVGLALADALRDIGIRLYLGQSVTALAPGQATLENGTQIRFDHALSAIGLVPRTTLAAAAGLTIDRGIVVDALLRTSDPDIYALGDCAQTAAGPLPFILPLMAQAKALAATLTGTETLLQLPALPVVVKTPCLPLALSPPALGAAGQWVTDGSGRDLKALFVGTAGEPLGFALSGSRAGERQALTKIMPDLLPAGA